MRTSILSLALAIWLAHSWYPESCCAGHDCNPVPCEDLSELNDGSVRYRQLIFPKNKVWPSKDSQCHVASFVGRQRSATPKVLSVCSSTRGPKSCVCHYLASVLGGYGLASMDRLLSSRWTIGLRSPLRPIGHQQVRGWSMPLTPRPSAVQTSPVVGVSPSNMSRIWIRPVLWSPHGWRRPGRAKTTVLRVFCWSLFASREKIGTTFLDL
jgi:hypothetical protein